MLVTLLFGFLVRDSNRKFIQRSIILTTKSSKMNCRQVWNRDRMQGRNSYRVSLGLFEPVSLGLGGTIGSGIFVVPGIAAGIAGPSSILPYIFVCISAYKIFHNKKIRFIASIGAVSTSIILTVYFSIFLV